MNLQEINKIVTGIVSSRLKIPKTEISPDPTLKELGGDSFDELEVILEQKLKIMLPDALVSFYKKMTFK